ncbi:hypothetical protein AGMMS50233_11230 [Endomicrobiia bacterium]|nr:hypothetical protein AGMMS50233_11230 [Endomicrobiia bacterium]
MKKGLLLMFVGVFVFVAGCKTQDVESSSSAAATETIAVPTSEPSIKGDSDVSMDLKTVHFDFIFPLSIKVIFTSGEIISFFVKKRYLLLYSFFDKF